MNDHEKLEAIKEKMKQRAKEIFKPAPTDIEDELKREKILGNPKNLIRPDNKEE
ncbi:hypothetical protein [Cellvibrio mixtus]|uniref:hypothetical protein n=1 Tax=Cellvibrio mixtus TaxID=39650 RepID=UPI0014835B33|nr:hypothetical protein [Cellvibrio mixtus]